MGTRAKTSALAWTNLTTVESDQKPGRFYDIDVRADGVLRCSCERFRFNRGQLGTAAKTCKHLDAYRLADAIERNITDAVPKKPDRLRVDGETFTFTKRSISFKPI